MDTAPRPTDSTYSSEQTPLQNDAEQEASRRLSLRSSQIPASVGGYEILRCLGEGSFGTVWLARERKTGRQVAIKFFTNRRGLDWSLLTREVEKLAVLDASRDVVRLLDVGVDHDPPYFVMEYLPHRSVAALLENGPLSVRQALDITRSVARALVHAHSAGILHCDIKPGNVLLDRGDEARLGDFGQSRLATDQGSALGTFYYMAPEQASRTAAPDVRWDVYALGALLYDMLTGAPPYRSPEAEERLRAAANLNERLAAYRELIAQSPQPVDHRAVAGIDAPLISLIDRCLERDPAKRIPNPQVVLDLLDQRERTLARRPLILLSIFGPVLVLLLLGWIAADAVPRAVDQAKAHLYERALASDLATARLLASSIQQELSDRQAELERLARRLPVGEGEGEGDYRGFRKESEMIEILDTWKKETDERFASQDRTQDESLFVTDRSGIQIFRSPRSDSIGHTFAYRDYFHGLGRELSPAKDDVSQIKPRNKAGVSTAFRSSNTDQFMVAIAAPIWSRDGQEVIGVLARTLHLTDLLEQWERRITGAATSSQDSQRYLTLVDMRESPPLLLDHSWMTSANLKALRKRDLAPNESLRLTMEEETQLRTAVQRGVGIDNFQDPLADLDPTYDDIWLAAPARTSVIDWLAIVQERRSEAVAPMSELNWMFVRYGLWMLVIFAVLLGLLGWLVRRFAAV